MAPVEMGGVAQRWTLTAQEGTKDSMDCTYAATMGPQGTGTMYPAVTTCSPAHPHAALSRARSLGHLRVSVNIRSSWMHRTSMYHTFIFISLVSRA